MSVTLLVEQGRFISVQAWRKRKEGGKREGETRRQGEGWAEEWEDGEREGEKGSGMWTGGGEG